ncbi:MAG: ATP-binding protein, partial [Chloroflexota bacterium]
IPWSLRTKLAVAFLLILFPMLGLVIYDYQTDYRQESSLVLDGELRTAQAVGAMLEATFDQGVAVGEAVAVDPAIRAFDPALLDPYLARYLPLYPQYESINVWDATGRNVGASVPHPADQPRPSIADREHFQRAMATGEPAASDVIIARTTGRPAVGVVVPVKDQQERLLGAVSVVLDLEMLPRGLQQVQVDSGQAVLVADRTGRLALHTTREEMAWEERDASRYPPIAEALSTGRFNGRANGLVTRDAQLATVVRTPRYGWVAGVSTDEAVALGGLQREAATELAGYLGIVLLAGLLGWGLTYAITRPLGDLTRTIVAFGRGHLEQRAQVRTGDELEVTAEAFNHMASALQREQDRLRFVGEMGATLVSTMEVDRVAQLLVERSTAVLGQANWVCLLPRDAECSVVSSYAVDPAIGLRLRELFQQHVQWVAANLFLPVAESGRPILIRDVAASQMEEGLRRGLVGLNATSWIVVPLVARGRTVGVLSSGSLSEERRFDDGDLALAMDLAGRAAVVIDNALLFQDVQEERGRLEELATESEQRRSELDAVIEGVSEGITIADGQGRIVRINSRGREILGLSPPAEGPFHLEDYVRGISLHYPDGRSMPADQWPIARAVHGEVVSGVEAVLAQPSGRRLNLLFSSGVVRDEQGRVRLAMSIFRDITPIRELERTREEFISVVAHDLRSPLTVITGFAGLLQRLPADQHGQEREARAVESILVSARRLEKMVADLLDASRIEARRLSLELQPVELPKLVREVVERMAETTRGHPVQVKVYGELPILQADPGRLEQVLSNLLSNAAKYSYPDSEIVVEVRLRPEKKEVMVSVANRGTGIAPEDRETIFTRFRRTKAVEGRVPGLGLGLYITRGLVEAHGGRIWVESEMEKTTAFRFTLPVTASSPK